MVGQIVPGLGNNFAKGILPHGIIHDVAKQTLPVRSADGDKVRLCPTVVVPRYTDGTALLLSRCIVHRAVGSLVQAFLAKTT